MHRGAAARRLSITRESAPLNDTYIHLWSGPVSHMVVHDLNGQEMLNLAGHPVVHFVDVVEPDGSVIALWMGFDGDEAARKAECYSKEWATPIHPNDATVHSLPLRSTLTVTLPFSALCERLNPCRYLAVRGRPFIGLGRASPPTKPWCNVSVFGFRRMPRPLT